jgi:hypothetical protein
MADIDDEVPLADIDHEVPALPIASRMKGQDGRPKPHIGPTVDDYKKVWGKTVGKDSDDFWRKVRVSSFSSSRYLGVT